MNLQDKQICPNWVFGLKQKKQNEKMKIMIITGNKQKCFKSEQKWVVSNYIKLLLIKFRWKRNLFHFHNGLAHDVLEPLLAKVSLLQVCLESLENLLNMILFRRVEWKSQHGEPLPFQVSLSAVAHVHGDVIEQDEGWAYVFFAKPVAELRVQKFK